MLGAIPREATLLQHLQRSFPGVRDVRLTRGGTCRYHLAVQIDKSARRRAEEHHHGRVRRRTTTSSRSWWSTPTSTSTIPTRSNGRSRRASRPTAISSGGPGRPGLQARSVGRPTESAPRWGFDATMPVTGPLGVQAHPRAGRRDCRSRCGAAGRSQGDPGQAPRRLIATSSLSPSRRPAARF